MMLALSSIFETASVLVAGDQVATLLVNANHMMN
jgi:hypothetical protein